MTSARVVVVAGCPRSGTTAVFDALGSDGRVLSLHEPNGGPEASDAAYRGELLRSGDELRPVLEAADGPVLLRGNEELSVRTLDDLADDLADYDLSIIWVYREAAKVIGSAAARGWFEPTPSRIEREIDEWERRNRSVLATVTERLTIVSYRDLTEDPSVLERLADRLGLQITASLGVDQGRGLAALPPGAARHIAQRTKRTLAALDERRDVRPGRRSPVVEVRPTPAASVTIAAAPSVAPEHLVGLRCHLSSRTLVEGDVTSWPLRAGTIGPAVAVGAVCAVREGRSTVVRFGDRPSGSSGRLELGDDVDWRDFVDGDWTMGLVVDLPSPDETGWAPLVTVGAPIAGGAGASLVWLGADTDERPRRPDGSIGERPTGTGLLLAGITGPSPGRLSSTTTAQPLATWLLDGPGRRRAAVVVRHRRDGDDSELLLVVGHRGAIGRSPAPRPPRAPEPPHGLAVGGHGDAPTHSFPGGVVELVAVGRALGGEELAGLVAHLSSTAGDDISTS